MSGWFGGGSLAQTEPALGDVKVQTSVYGTVVPVGYGRCKVAPNLLWYGDFKVLSREEYGEGGKGGGSPVRTSYAYQASVMMSLGEGSISAVRNIWVGKEKFGPVAATSRRRNGVHEVEIGQGSGPVTVPNSATFLEPSSVVFPAKDPAEYSDFALTEGVHYTRSGGTYTFNSSLFLGSDGEFLTRRIRITYLYESVSDAMTALASVGLTLRSGTFGQPVWSHLASNFADQAIPYSGISYVYGRDYNLDGSAAVPNHNFEVDWLLPYSDTIPDANPAAVIRDVLTNPVYGGSMPSSLLGDWTQYSNYCVANGLFVSPFFNSQRTLRDIVSELLEATNSMPAWDGEALRLVPRGDKTVTGNGVTYSPDLVIAADITMDDLVAGEINPIRIERIAAADAWNKVTVEYSDRDQDYRTVPVTVTDQAAVEEFGLRSESSQSWTFFCLPAAANQAAEIRLKRHQAARATCRFKLPGRFIQLVPGDLLRLFDPRAYLDAFIVRIVSISDDPRTRDRSIVAEEFPIGTAAAPLIAPQLGSGFKPEYNADPGDVVTPVFLEMPTPGGLEIRVGVTGQANKPYWGGCEIYASIDGGASYKLVGRALQKARFGTLSSALAAGAGATLDVTLAGKGGALNTTSDAEADALATLCFVGTPESGEWLAFETATLTSSNRYSLTGLRRGRFGSADQAAASGVPFAFIDGALVIADDVPLSMVGRQINFKFASYNVFGGALQSLAVAPEYTYTVSGRFIGASSSGIGSNRVVNASWTYGVTGWDGTTEKDPADTFDAELDYWGPPENAARAIGGILNASPSNAILRQKIGGPGSFVYRYSKPMSVEPGKTYFAAIRACPVHCNARMQINWFDEAAQYLGAAFDTAVVEDRAPLGASAIDFRPRENYPQLSIKAVAPAGAKTARIYAVKTGTKAGQTQSEVSWLEPQFDPCSAEAIEPPSWTPGGQNSVGTAILEENAATVVYRPAAAIKDSTFPAGWDASQLRELLRFTPEVSGPLELHLSGEVACTSAGSAYIFETGVSVVGAAESAKNISGVFPFLGAVCNVPSTVGEIVVAAFNWTVQLTAVAGQQIVVNLNADRYQKVITKSLSSSRPAGTDVVRNIVPYAVLIKR